MRLTPAGLCSLGALVSSPPSSLSDEPLSKGISKNRNERRFPTRSRTHRPLRWCREYPCHRRSRWQIPIGACLKSVTCALCRALTACLVVLVHRLALLSGWRCTNQMRPGLCVCVRALPTLAASPHRRHPPGFAPNLGARRGVPRPLEPAADSLEVANSAETEQEHAFQAAEVRSLLLLRIVGRSNKNLLVDPSSRGDRAPKRV
jgi:hypothetical protein